MRITLQKYTLCKVNVRHLHVPTVLTWVWGASAWVQRATVHGHPDVLAGSAATMDTCVRNFAKMVGLDNALVAATRNPAKVCATRDCMGVNVCVCVSVNGGCVSVSVWVWPCLCMFLCGRVGVMCVCVVVRARMSVWYIATSLCVCAGFRSMWHLIDWRITVPCS